MLAAWQPCYAQNDSLRIVALDPVLVTADKQKLSVSPAQTLEGRTLQQLSVHSVADALRYFSGLQIKDYGGIGGLKTVNVRSLGSQHTGVFYDGIQIGNAQNGIVDLGRFSLDNVEAVSLYNGQKSNLLQTARDYASAHAVYITTRTPRFDSTADNKLLATMRGGSFGTINPSLLWESKLSERFSLSLNTEALYTTGRYKFNYSKQNGYDTTEWRRNGDVKAIRIEAGLFGSVNNGSWKTKLYWYNSERGYPGASVREVPGKFPNQDRQWDNNLFIQSSFQKSVTNRYSILANAKYANDYLHYVSDPRLDISTMHIDNTYRQQEWYGSFAQLFTFTRHWTANLSVDGIYNTLTADLYDFVYPRRLTNLVSLSSSYAVGRMQLQGALLNTWVNETTKLANRSAGNKQQLTPSLVLSWKPFAKEDLQVRAFYKKIFRMPTLNDLYYTFIGNRYLEPEFTTQYNAGVNYTRGIADKGLHRIHLQADAYFNQVDNKIIAMPTSNQFRWTMINLGYTEIRGLDVSGMLQWKFKELTIDTRLSYTYQKAQDFTNKNDPYYGGQIPYIPIHSGSFILAPQFKNWHLQYSFIYTGDRYEAVANIPENYTRPWYTHDLSVTRNLRLKTTYARVTLAVNNIFNQQYEVVQWYPMPGINYKATVQVTIL